MCFLAIFVLNAALSSTNLWPTPFLRLDARVAPEFVYVWVLLLAWLAWRKSVSRRWLAGLTWCYLALVAGRYFDTTAPALFGRPINLYWDGLQIPTLLHTISQGYPWWGAVLMGLALILLVWSSYAVLRWGWGVAAREVAPYALRSRWALTITAFFLLSSVANLLGAQITWPYISKPVVPTYVRQAKLFVAAFSDQAQRKVLPPSPPFTSDFAALNNADVKLFLLESYGAVAYDNPKACAALTASRLKLEAAATETGQKIVSAFVTSTTFGGGSDLAHVALLTGVDTRDPLQHDVLITTNRPTLMRHARSKGYETYGFYPGLSWAWPEKKFFGYDHFNDGRDVQYQGPKLGYWEIPDQVALAKFAQLQPVKTGDKPRMLAFFSATSHLPFHPVPPYQPDWARVTTATPFDEAVVAPLLASKVNWLDMLPGYVGMIDYNHQWLAGYLKQPYPRDYILIAVGDHQPAANVSGEGASWDVPVHVISSRPDLLQRFVSQGFAPGLDPPRKPIGTLMDLTVMILNAFDSKFDPAAAKP
jgi:Sulfatase